MCQLVFCMPGYFKDFLPRFLKCSRTTSITRGWTLFIDFHRTRVYVILLTHQPGIWFLNESNPFSFSLMDCQKGVIFSWLRRSLSRIIPQTNCEKRSRFLSSPTDAFFVLLSGLLQSCGAKGKIGIFFYLIGSMWRGVRCWLHHVYQTFQTLRNETFKENEILFIFLPGKAYKQTFKAIWFLWGAGDLPQMEGLCRLYFAKLRVLRLRSPQLA